MVGLAGWSRRAVSPGQEAVRADCQWRVAATSLSKKHVTTRLNARRVTDVEVRSGEGILTKESWVVAAVLWLWLFLAMAHEQLQTPGPRAVRGRHRSSVLAGRHQTERESGQPASDSFSLHNPHRTIHQIVNIPIPFINKIPGQAGYHYAGNKFA